MDRSDAHDPHDICACAQLRKAARAVTRHYDAALRSTGLKITQFSILRVLNALGETRMTALAERLGLENSSLTRNLRPLARRDLVEIAPASDSRVRLVRITAAGRRALAEAQPHWRKAQDYVIGAIGTDRAGDLFAELTEIGRAARR